MNTKKTKVEKIKENKAGRIASLVLGIISIVLSFFYYISIPSGILAIVLGYNGIKKYDSGLAKAGFVLGIIGLVLCVAIYGFITCTLVLFNM